MKTHTLFLLAGFFLFLGSCSKSESPSAPPVVIENVFVDFEIHMTGSSPNARLYLVNKTKNADNYRWRFSEGGDIDSSLAANPDTLTIDKKGTFTVTLTASKGADMQTLTKTIAVGGFSALREYKDLPFGIHNMGTMPYCFSTATGKFYQRSEINAVNGSLIDLVYWKDGINGLCVFMTPGNLWLYPSFTIPDARKTSYVQWKGALQVSLDQFAVMQNDSLLHTLDVTDDNQAFTTSQLPHIVLFKNTLNKNGVILVKSIGRDHVVMDIKMQKY